MLPIAVNFRIKFVKSLKLFSHLIEQGTTFGGWNMIETGLIDVSMALLDMSCSFSVNKKNVSKILCGQGHEIIRLVTRKRSSSIIRVLKSVKSFSEIIKIIHERGNKFFLKFIKIEHEQFPRISFSTIWPCRCPRSP